MLFGGTFGGDEAGAELWDMATGTLVHTLSVGEDTTRSVAFSPDGTKVLVASRTGALLFDSATGAAIRKFMHDGSGDRYVRSVAFSPDGSKLLTGGGDYAHGPCAKLWDATTTGLLIQTFSTDGESVTGVAFSPDSSKVLTAAGVANKNDALFGLWDAANGKLLRSFKIAAVEGYSVAFSPDGTRVLLGANSTTYLFDATAVGNDAGCFGKKSVLGFGDLEALLEDLFLSVLSLLCLFVAAPRLGPRR
jgi:WD40 repeat protein